MFIKHLLWTDIVLIYLQALDSDGDGIVPTDSILMTDLEKSRSKLLTYIGKLNTAQIMKVGYAASSF